MSGLNTRQLPGRDHPPEGKQDKARGLEVKSVSLDRHSWVIASIFKVDHTCVNFSIKLVLSLCRQVVTFRLGITTSLPYWVPVAIKKVRRVPNNLWRHWVQRRHSCDQEHKHTIIMLLPTTRLAIRYSMIDPSKIVSTKKLLLVVTLRGPVLLVGLMLFVFAPYWLWGLFW